jgi:acyl carrier protein
MYEQREKLGQRSSIPTSQSAAEFDDRLVRCISSVLPTLAEEEIRSAEVQHLADADSLTVVTLVALINDEFGLDLDLEDLLKLGDFERICEYLRDEQPPAGTTLNRRRVE